MLVLQAAPVAAADRPRFIAKLLPNRAGPIVEAYLRILIPSRRVASQLSLSGHP